MNRKEKLMHHVTYASSVKLKCQDLYIKFSWLVPESIKKGLGRIVPNSVKLDPLPTSCYA